MICTTEQATICVWITKKNLHRPSLQKTLCGQTTCCAGKGGDRWLVHTFSPPCRICRQDGLPMSTIPISALVEAGSDAADGYSLALSCLNPLRSAAACVHIYGIKCWTTRGSHTPTGKSRGVIPFSCAYLAADASTRGRAST